MHKIWNICACASCYYGLIQTIYKFFGIVTARNCNWGYPLIHSVCRWCHECGHIFLLEISTSTQFIKLKLRNNKLGSKTIYNLHTRIQSVLRKRCCENMQQIYRAAPMPKCDFNKTALNLYWNLTSAWDTFRTPFPKNTSRGLLLFVKEYFQYKFKLHIMSGNWQIVRSNE